MIDIETDTLDLSYDRFIQNRTYENALHYFLQASIYYRDEMINDETFFEIQKKIINWYNMQEG